MFWAQIVGAPSVLAATPAAVPFSRLRRVRPLVLVVSALYNLFGNTLNLGGIHLEFEEGEGEGGAEETPAGVEG